VWVSPKKTQAAWLNATRQALGISLFPSCSLCRLVGHDIQFSECDMESLEENSTRIARKDQPMSEDELRNLLDEFTEEELADLLDFVEEVGGYENAEIAIASLEQLRGTTRAAA
jgi:hypothetical protein